MRSHFLLLVSCAGVVEVAIKAEAVPSLTSCDNEIVSVPQRGRIDLVKKSLIVKVGFKEKDFLSCTLFFSFTINWRLSDSFACRLKELRLSKTLTGFSVPMVKENVFHVI